MVHVPLMFLSEWREFPSAPCLAGEKKLMTARVSMLLKSRASPDMLPFSLCNMNRLAIRPMKRPFFPTTLSIPSYDIGKKVGLRTYQHPLVHCLSCHHRDEMYLLRDTNFSFITFPVPTRVLMMHSVPLCADCAFRTPRGVTARATT